MLKHFRVAAWLTTAVCALVAVPVLAAYLGATKALPATLEIVEPSVLVLSPVAETSLAQARESDGVVVLKVNIDRIKDSSTGQTAVITGGLGSYRATVGSAPGGGIQFLAVKGVLPFDNLTFDTVTGVFSVSGVSALIQADNTTVAKVVPRLTGNTTTSYDLTVAFSSINAAADPELNVPEEYAKTIILLRGDANKSGGISIADSLALKQYLVGQLVLSQISPLNAASPNHDGAAGDKITVVDALAVEQYLVRQLNAYFE